MGPLGKDPDVALKIELKPDEKILLGDCVITNAGKRTRLLVEGAVPILREKDIMSLAEADTPAKLIYLRGAVHLRGQAAAGSPRALLSAGGRILRRPRPARSHLLKASTIES